MFHVTPNPERLDKRGTSAPQCAPTDTQADRLEARLAELDEVHSTETKRLNALLVAAKKKLFVLKKVQEG